MLTGVVAETGFVAIAKLAVEAPVRTVTMPGTVASVLLDETSMLVPAPAFALRVTAPVAATEPITDEEVSLTPLKTAGFTISVADFAVVPTVAVMRTESCWETGLVVTAKVTADA